VLLVSSDTLHGLVVGALGYTDRIIDEYPRWGALAFMALAALSAMLAFFSSAILVPVGVSAWGTTFCLLLLWAGWVLGGIGTYALGRSTGRPIAALLSSWGAVSRYEDRISRHTPFWVVVLFQAAMPSEVPGYVLGIARYSFWKYLAVLAIIELPWALGTVYLSEGLLERRLTLIIALCLAGVGITVSALYLLLNRLRDDGGVWGWNALRSRSGANASVGEMPENGDRSA
jgi:uncharacterized membrane protein YdjX (TVP38/TMEM64 family)